MTVRTLFARRMCLLSVCVFSCAALPAAAEYPDKPLRIICAHAPGGAADQLSRIVADRLGHELHQTVIVENRPGASTMLAAEQVARSPGDGYTLLMATVTTLSINPYLYGQLRYDPVRDFEPVTVVASTPFFLAVNAGVPAASVSELVALAKREPRKLNVGSSGNGTSSHLAAELFNDMAGVQTVHVPYKATATRNNELAAGVIQMVFGNDVMPMVQAGKARVLAVTSNKRLSGYPDIPTVAESGVPGFEASVWYGLVAPKGTPDAVVQKLHAALARVLSTPDVRRQVMTSLGGDVVANTPAEFAALIRSDGEKWHRVIQRAGIKVTE
ncbi:tripartite tricarboxylate transporter substrate binding protein [Pigmentiphaga sp. GD03639]|uniref:Tripartite tricarboxylate transporter substrate binding protein n=1 Tax=Pigmentiphaga daeguensis TaxID=414049 RepID=A0ABN1CGA8_9BURK|nr:tripartite tricarboxylate transporter substrate binding protein [Pigmentiphaga sp. GD03639]MDH2236347.1 tripartite tricarboxylate transporter substrate binding protein [Pigmentiphaga sp. GD03639]